MNKLMPSDIETSGIKATRNVRGKRGINLPLGTEGDSRRNKAGTLSAPLSNKEIRWHAKEFVKGLLNGRDTLSMCFVTCASLAGYLSAIGVRAREVEGWCAGHHHYWVELYDGRIIDPTADQFEHGDGSRFSNRWVCKLPNYYVKADLSPKHDPSPVVSRENKNEK